MESKETFTRGAAGAWTITSAISKLDKACKRFGYEN